MRATTILTLLVVAGLSAGCSAVGRTRARPQRELDGLSGQVRTVTTRTTTRSLLGEDSPAGLVETRHYNPAGWLTEETYHDHQNVLLFKVSYDYDRSGNLAQWIVLDPTGSSRERIVYEHDSEGRAIKAIQYRAGDIAHGQTTFKYDNSGRLSEAVVYNTRGAVVDRWTYGYDAAGRRTEEVRYFADGSVDSRYQITFDERGNWKERLKLRADGALIERESYSYEFDGRGNWIAKSVARWAAGSASSSLVPSESVSRTISYH